MNQIVVCRARDRMQRGEFLHIFIIHMQRPFSWISHSLCAQFRDFLFWRMIGFSQFGMQFVVIHLWWARLYFETRLEHMNVKGKIQFLAHLKLSEFMKSTLPQQTNEHIFFEIFFFSPHSCLIFIGLARNLDSILSGSIFDFLRFGFFFNKIVFDFWRFLDSSSIKITLIFGFFWIHLQWNWLWFLAFSGFFFNKIGFDFWLFLDSASTLNLIASVQITMILPQWVFCFVSETEIVHYWHVLRFIIRKCLLHQTKLQKCVLIIKVRSHCIDRCVFYPTDLYLW